MSLDGLFYVTSPERYLKGYGLGKGSSDESVKLLIELGESYCDFYTVNKRNEL